MNTAEAMRMAINGAQRVLDSYVSDLEEKDLFVRALPDTNHIAWHMGHLISSENSMMDAIRPGSCPKLPEGFKAAHAKENSKSDDISKFSSKAQYLDLIKKQRAATFAVLETLSDSDFDKPGPERLRSYAPTIGAVMILQANHILMHAGQFVAIRRKLGKPVLI